VCGRKKNEKLNKRKEITNIDKKEKEQTINQKEVRKYLPRSSSGVVNRLGK